MSPCMEHDREHIFHLTLDVIKPPPVMKTSPAQAF